MTFSHCQTQYQTWTRRNPFPRVLPHGLSYVTPLVLHRLFYSAEPRCSAEWCRPEQYYISPCSLLRVMPKQPLSRCYRAASPLEALHQPLQMYDVKISAGPNQPNGSLFLTLPLRSVLGAYGNPNYSSEPNCHTQPAWGPDEPILRKSVINIMSIL